MNPPLVRVCAGTARCAVAALVLAAVALGSLTAAAQPNVAQGKPAKQSSEGWGGAASRAVDGNTSGTYADNSVTHTLSDQGAWWEVDLGGVYSISKIEIHNRTDDSGAGEPARLSNFEVVVSRDGATYDRVYHQAGAAAQVTAFSLSSPPSARYVRVRLLDTNYLSLAEVKVFGAPPSFARSPRRKGPRRGPFFGFGPAASAAVAPPVADATGAPDLSSAGVVPSLEQRQHGEGYPEHAPADEAKGKVAAGVLRLKEGVGKKVGGFFTLLTLLKDVAGGVKDVAQDAAKGVGAGPGALIKVALDGLLLRGIADPDLRGIISSALAAVADRFSDKDFNLKKGVIAVLGSLAANTKLGALIAKAIPIPELQGVIEQGVQSVLKNLANEAGVSALMNNTLGFLTEVGVKLIDDIKVKVANALVGVVQIDPKHKQQLRDDLVGAIDKLKAAIRERSFAELLSFGKLLGTIFVRGLYDQFIRLLGDDKTVAAAKKMLGELAGKLAAVFPAVSSITDPIIEGLGAGASKFAKEAKLCREMITGLNKKSAEGVLKCLKLALGQAATTAGVGIAQGLYDAFIKLLQTKVPEARDKLKEASLALADKIPGFPAAVKDMAGKVIEGLKEGAQKFAGEAALCREQITGLNVATVKGLFGCLKQAFFAGAGAAGAGIAQGLYDGFIDLLRKNALGPAKDKLKDLVAKLKAVLPDVQSLAKPILDGLGAGADKLADEAAMCRNMITGFNKESARGVFGCLTMAFRTGAGAAVAGVAQGLYDGFIDLLRKNALGPAKDKLKDLVAKLKAVLPDVQSLAKPILDGLGAGADKLADEAAMCRNMITGFNKESARGVFGCLKMAFRTGAGAAVAGVAQGLYDGFIDLLRKNALGPAKDKLKDLVAKLKAVLPDVQSLAKPILDGLGAGADKLADEAAMCRNMITGFNKESARGVFGCLMMAFRTGAGAAVAGVAQGLYDGFIDLLRNKAIGPAKAKLQDLVAKLTAVLPDVQSLAKPILDGLGAGADKLADEAAMCRNMITGFNKESAKGVFGCLTMAFRTGAGAAVAGVAQGLYDGFIDLLRKNALGPAKAKLKDLVAKLKAVLPDVQSLAKPILDGLGAGADKLADEAAMCRNMITGFNKESARGVFGCLKMAFRTGAGAAVAGVAQGLYDGFINLLRKNALGPAKDKLKDLVAKLKAVLPDVQSLAKPILDGLGAGADKLADEAAMCRNMITGFNKESAKGVFACLKMAFRTGAGAAGAGIAKGLYDQFIKLLRNDKTLAQAKTKLRDLAGRLPAQVKSIAKGVIDAINVGAKQFADDAAMCGGVITGINVASARALFRCLKLALRQGVMTAGATVARKAFDAFIAMLRKNAAQAKALLQRVASSLVAVLPAARSLVTPIAAALGPQTVRAVVDIEACGATLKTLDAETVRGFFSCLRLAVRSATQVGATKLREYFGKFVQELRGNATAARARLNALAKALRAYVPQAVSLLNAVSARIGAPSVELSQTAAICAPMLTALDNQNVLGLARCLELAFRGTQSNE